MGRPKRTRASLNAGDHHISAAEAQTALKGLNLQSLVIGDHLVVTRSDFDAVIGGDLYLALMVLYNVESGQFVARIWNETVTSGRAPGLEDFLRACKDHFHFKPCVGSPVDGGEQVNFKLFPSNRKFSRTCRRFLTDKDVDSCPECLMLTPSQVHVKCEVEVTPDPEPNIGKLGLEEEGWKTDTVDKSESGIQDDLEEAAFSADNIGEEWNEDLDDKKDVAAHSIDQESYDAIDKEECNGDDEDVLKSDHFQDEVGSTHTKFDKREYQRTWKAQKLHNETTEQREARLQRRREQKSGRK